MRALTLVLTDLYLYDDDTGLARLPALETLLARGTLRHAGDWRAWVCAQYDIGVQDTVPVADLSLRADPRHELARAGEHAWLVSPVELHAEPDRVWLDLEGPLSLTAAEWQQLCRDFNETFAAAGWRLEPGGERYGFLRTTRRLSATTVDPARCIGRDVRHALPDGTDGRELRRLMTEIQMWLHASPPSAAHGASEVNALWIWGGGELTARPEARELPQLLGDDPFLRGVWNLHKGVVQPAPRQLPDQAAARDVLAGVCMRAEPSAAGTDRLASLDSLWFAPALRALRAGRLRQVNIHVNDRLLTVSSTDRWRFWRRVRPWYEALR